MADTRSYGLAIAVPRFPGAKADLRRAVTISADPEVLASQAILEVWDHLVAVVLPDRSGLTRDTHQTLEEVRDALMDVARGRGWAAVLVDLGTASDPTGIRATTEAVTASSMGGWDLSDPHAPRDATAAPRLLMAGPDDTLVAFAMVPYVDAAAAGALKDLQDRDVAVAGPGLAVNGALGYALAALPGTPASEALLAQCAAWRADPDGRVEAGLVAFGSGSARLLDATRLPAPDEDVPQPW